jgi:hypothetical protein
MARKRSPVGTLQAYGVNAETSASMARKRSPVGTVQAYGVNPETAATRANKRALAAFPIGGGKLSRSEVVTVRLDPKTRYLAELAARRQRRTLSSYIEWVVAESLVQFIQAEQTTNGEDEDINGLWDVDDCDRLVKLALYDKSLLNYREQVLWKRIQEQAAPGDLDLSERKVEWENIRRIWSQLETADGTDASSTTLLA